MNVAAGLLLVGALLLLVGVAAVSVPAAFICAGLFCILGAIGLAAAQENAPPRSREAMKE